MKYAWCLFGKKCAAQNRGEPVGYIRYKRCATRLNDTRLSGEEIFRAPPPTILAISLPPPHGLRGSPRRMMERSRFPLGSTISLRIFGRDRKSTRLNSSHL